MKLIEFLRSFVGRGGKGQAAGGMVLLGIENEVIEVDRRVLEGIKQLSAERDRLCEEVRNLRFQLGEAYNRLCAVQASDQIEQ